MSEFRLSGRCWPIHFKPYDDELLSSWLIRLIRAHGAEPKRFCQNVWRQTDFWHRDIDRGSYPGVIEVIAEKAATPVDRVLDTTLMGYAGFHPRQPNGVGVWAWVLSTGLYGGQRQRPWLQYCPQCLRNDPGPYFRRRWRLAFMTVCLPHRRRLLDGCRACGAPCNFYQLPGTAKAITQCHRCGYDARRAKALPLRATQAEHQLGQFQHFLIDALQRGWCELPGPEPVSSDWYFHMVQKLLRLLIGQRRGQVLRQALCRQLRQPFFEPRFPSVRARTLEVLPVTDRFKLMLLLSGWLAEWPSRFITLCQKANLQTTGLTQELLFRPEWSAQAGWPSDSGTRTLSTTITNQR